jgi:hypothetical protein
LLIIEPNHPRNSFNTHRQKINTMPIFGSKKQAVTGGTPTTNATTPQHSDTLDLKVICEPVHANIE